MLTDDCCAPHRSVLCDDDPPWCHSDWHATNHCPAHTALPCVSIISISCWLGKGHSIDMRQIFLKANSWLVSSFSTFLLSSMLMSLEKGFLVILVVNCSAEVQGWHWPRWIFNQIHSQQIIHSINFNQDIFTKAFTGDSQLLWLTMHKYYQLLINYNDSIADG